MKIFFNKAKYFFLFTILLSGFSSCRFFEEYLNEPVKEYFKDYTETAGIMRYEITGGEYHEDANGRISIFSSSDAEITFYLRNPQKFNFSVANANLDFSALNNEDVKKVFGVEAEKSLVRISQDSQDYTVLTLSYPSEFLTQTETGFEISPEITLSHPVSQIPFETYSDLKLYSNSAPPPVYGAAVYQNQKTTPNTYVLFFNMLDKLLLKGIHQDISSISISKSSAGSSAGEIQSSIEIEDDGSFSFENDEFFKIGNTSADYTPSSVLFVEKGQPAYFITRDALSDQNTTYTITLKDKAGLSSSVQANVYSTKLGDVSILNSVGQKISSGDELEQDTDSSYATLILKPAETATDGKETYNTADSVVVYEIYQGENDSGKLLMSGTNSGGELKLQIPSGAIFVRAYARKNLFADSSVKECVIHVLRSTLYVSPNGNDFENNGSENSPFATITKAISEFSHLTKRGRIYLLGNVDESPELSIQNANLEIFGNGNSVSGFTMSAAGGKLTANNLLLSGALSVSSGTLTANNVSINGLAEVSNSGTANLTGGSAGGITVSGGSASLTGTTIGGTATVSSGNATLTNGTITGNTNVTGGTLTLSNTSANGEITVSGGNLSLANATVNADTNYTGGALTLEGSTKIQSGNKITMASGLEIGVKNLSADFVANLSAANSLDTWTRGTALIASESGDTKAMSETVQKFTLDSSKWVLVADSAGTKGVLGTNEASVEIKEFILEFQVEPPELEQGKESTLNITPIVKLKSTGETFNFTTSDFTDWNISLYYQNVQVKNSSSQSITISSDYPDGTYTLRISVKYKEIYYNSNQEIKLK